MKPHTMVLVVVHNPIEYNWATDLMSFLAVHPNLVEEPHFTNVAVCERLIASFNTYLEGRKDYDPLTTDLVIGVKGLERNLSDLMTARQTLNSNMILLNTLGREAFISPQISGQNSRLGSLERFVNQIKDKQQRVSGLWERHVGQLASIQQLVRAERHKLDFGEGQLITLLIALRLHGRQRITSHQRASEELNAHC